jgi:hypothetical protein
MKTWIKVGMHVMPKDWDWVKQGNGKWVEIAPEKIGAGPVVVEVKGDKARLNYDNWAIFTGVDFRELGCAPNDFFFDEDELQNYEN